MAGKPLRDEKKTGLHLTVTPTTKRTLKQIGKSLGMSQSELVETWAAEARKSSEPKTTGKILERLKALEKSHLDYVGTQGKRLEKLLAENHEHKTKIKKEIRFLEEEIQALILESSES
ncbi:hypothetical protein [Okeania sp.]|uniref:hypothetical protein n=1 Tax=Okeania sp. TaxID=3100323 RepID=UPI002B4B9499|nr:hypothetical protein [Okeania sp.]MEB3339235.1 hypothetical protein [Okeania sp.]